MNKLDISMIPFFIVLFLYALSVVPLKDIEDIDGDVKNEISNLFAKFDRNLLIFSTGGLLLDSLLILLFPFNEILKIYLLIFSISTIALNFFYRKKNLKKLYQTIIYLVIMECIIFAIHMAL